MRVLAFAAVLLAGCAAPPPAAPEPNAAPSPEASGETAGLPRVCGDVPYRPLASTRQNYSLAAEFYRSASSPYDNLDPRGSYCAAMVYLRWMTANAPLYTGSDPDDRSFLRLANVYEFFAGNDRANRRMHLDSALAVRARGLAVLQRDGIAIDDARRALARGRFFYSYSDAYEDAAMREASAYQEAIRAAPDSVSDWYLRRLVVLTAETIPDPVVRADALDALAPLADDPDLQTYIAGVAEYVRQPRTPEPITVWTPEDLLAAYDGGEYADCTPPEDVQHLVYASSEMPETVAASGGDPEAILDTLLDCVTGGVGDPRTLTYLFRRSWSRGDRVQAEDYFERALDASASDRERSQLLSTRAARGQGNARALYERAVRLDALNARAAYALVRLDAERIGAPRNVRDRMVFWCLADRLDAIASLGDAEVRPLALRVRDGYLRAAPTAEDVFFLDIRPGDTVRPAYNRVACTTRVR